MSAPYIPPPLPQPPVPQQTPSAPPQRTRRQTAWIVAGSITATVALFAAAIGASWYARSNPSQNKLVRECRSAVAGRLRAPGSARWPGGEIVSHGATTWTVQGDVDAQNGFGALLRMSWECTAERDGGWQILDVDVDESR